MRVPKSSLYTSSRDNVRCKEKGAQETLVKKSPLGVKSALEIREMKSPGGVKGLMSAPPPGVKASVVALEFSKSCASSSGGVVKSVATKSPASNEYVKQ